MVSFDILHINAANLHIQINMQINPMCMWKMYKIELNIHPTSESATIGHPCTLIIMKLYFKGTLFA